MNASQHVCIVTFVAAMIQFRNRGCINPLRAKFFRGNINTYLHFVSFPHIDTTQVHVVEILPQTRQEPTYPT